MCAHGDTVPVDVFVPAHLSHTGTERLATVHVDRCLADTVRSLNDAGFQTAGCCCGHGRGSPSIVLHDGREFIRCGGIWYWQVDIGKRHRADPARAFPGPDLFPPPEEMRKALAATEKR